MTNKTPPNRSVLSEVLYGLHEPDESTPVDIPTVNQVSDDMGFTFLSDGKYKEIRTALNEIEIDAEGWNSDSSDIKIQIKTSLDRFGISFVTGPIRVGKTVLMDHFGKQFENAYSIERIDSEDLVNKKPEIGSVVELYFHWLHEIADNLCTKLGTRIRNLDRVTKSRIENLRTFEKWLEGMRPSGDSNLQAFLRVIDRLKDVLQFDKELLITFHLDDIHTYISEKVFRELKTDIEDLPRDPDDSHDLSVKLLIASRYLPYLRKQSIVFIPHFSEGTVKQISQLLKDEMSDGQLNELNKLIVKNTDGYPWFVMRFFNVYLVKRINGIRSIPIQLADQIFNNKDNWVVDTILGKNETSEFLDELNSLLRDSTKKLKSEFKDFIMLPPEETLLNDGWRNVNHFLIMQSGFFKINSSLDTFKGNGCLILKNHFIKEIETEL